MAGKRKSERSTRRKLCSPGRPPVWQRETLCRFWQGIAAGLSSEEAGIEAGVSAPVGSRWFRSSGGMPPTHLTPSVSRLQSRSLSFSEREEIALECARKTGVRAIARKLGRSPSTISREIRRNSATRSGDFNYRAIIAQWHADRAAQRPKVSKLAQNSTLREYVHDRLAGLIATPDGVTLNGPVVIWKKRRAVHRQSRRWSLAWSPEQIAQRLKMDFPEDQSMRISHEAIYQALYIQGRGALKHELSACLRSGRALRLPRERARKRGRSFVEEALMISDRPAEVADRAVPGHWEGDLILGLGSSAIGTLVERTTRFTKHRGWKEGPRNSAYMRALKESVMSLYEVSDIVPGQSLMARDLLRGGKPVMVREGTATKTLRPWDRIAARLVPEDGYTILAGGLLAYSRTACEDLAGHLYDVLRRKRGKAEFPKVRTEVLRDLAPMFTLTWLFRTLENMVGQSALPVLFNGDGEDLVFHDICFPLARGVTQKTVADVLEKLPGLRSEGQSFWNWLRMPGQKKATSSGSSHQDVQAHFLSSEMDDGSIVLGTLELKGRQLRLEVNSKSRAEQGQAMLKDALGDLVGVPLTQIMTAQQAMEDRDRGEGCETLDVQIPPEEEARILAEVLERHYRRTLDDVVPALGNMTPRQAVRTAQGRKAVAAWLKQIENTTAGLGRAKGTPPFSFDWMWDELGIASLRE